MLLTVRPGAKCRPVDYYLIPVTGIGESNNGSEGQTTLSSNNRVQLPTTYQSVGHSAHTAEERLAAPKGERIATT